MQKREGWALQNRERGQLSVVSCQLFVFLNFVLSALSFDVAFDGAHCPIAPKCPAKYSRYKAQSNKYQVAIN